MRKPPPSAMRGVQAVAAFVVLAVALPARAQTVQDSVHAAYERYRHALLAGDGAAAVEALDRSAADLYDRYVDLVLDADSATVRDLGVVDRLTVLSLRHRVPADTVRAFTGASALAYAVEHGWIDRASVLVGRLGRVDADGDRASAATNAGDGVAVPFRRRDGVWRPDLAALMEASGPALRAMIAETGQSDDEFIAYALLVLSRRAVSDDVWQPLGRR